MYFLMIYPILLTNYKWYSNLVTSAPLSISAPFTSCFYPSFLLLMPSSCDYLFCKKVVSLSFVLSYLPFSQAWQFQYISDKHGKDEETAYDKYNNSLASNQRERHPDSIAATVNREGTPLNPVFREVLYFCIKVSLIVLTLLGVMALQISPSACSFIGGPNSEGV